MYEYVQYSTVRVQTSYPAAVQTEALQSLKMAKMPAAVEGSGGGPARRETRSGESGESRGVEREVR